MIIWHIIFWTTLFLILHSYLLYPWILQVLSARKKENDLLYSDEALPAVSIIMSVYNEEKVIAEKLDSMLDAVYSPEKITILVGSDASSDRTNEILAGYHE